MRQKSNSFVFIVVILGLIACSWVANMLYNWKAHLSPYEAKTKTQFYAGMDKFLSNISWMTLIQWWADDTRGMTAARADALYTKLDSLTNLDPLFADAYLDGALSIAPVKPDLAVKLLDKAMRMGLDKHWKIPFYAGQIHLTYSDSPGAAQPFLEIAGKDPNAPPFVKTSLIHARCREQGEEPVASMQIWYDYFKTIDPQQYFERNLAAAQIREYGNTALDDMDNKLQGATEATTRESMLKQREIVNKILEDLDRSIGGGGGGGERNRDDDGKIIPELPRQRPSATRPVI